MLFRNGCAEPTQLNHLVPDAFMGALIIIIQNLANVLRGAFPVEEFARFVPEEFLIIGKIKIHGPFGLPVISYGKDNSAVDVRGNP